MWHHAAVKLNETLVKRFIYCTCTTKALCKAALMWLYLYPTEQLLVGCTRAILCRQRKEGTGFLPVTVAYKQERVQTGDPLYLRNM